MDETLDYLFVVRGQYTLITIRYQRFLFAMDYFQHFPIHFKREDRKKGSKGSKQASKRASEQGTYFKIILKAV
jgi:hypothetical protein